MLNHLRSFVYLLYPQICAGCGNDLQQVKQCICDTCISDLPYTNDQPKQNYLASQLMAMEAISGVYALCYYNHKNKVEKLIHQLKYNNRKDIGKRLGIELGTRLLQLNSYSFDVIIPVPLHPKKEAKRGFNQSYAIAQGVKEILDIPIDTKSFIRTVHTTSQTKKSRVDRFKNMENAFEVINPMALKGKHVLLIDDVMTTGATEISCASILLKVGAKDVFLASLAKADIL